MGRRQNFHHRKTSTLIPATTRQPVYTLVCEEPVNWGHFLPEQTTAVSILDRLLHHATVVVTHGESRRMQDARNHREAHTKT